MTISVLCAHDKSNYYQIPGLDIYNAERDAYNFTGLNPVICHPPCAQWSQMRAFSNQDERLKNLANFCFRSLVNNGGIFEHPSGSMVWKQFNWPTGTKIISVNQSWFGFPAQKKTILAFYRCSPISHPLSFDAVTHVLGKRKNGKRELSKSQRSLTTLSFNQWLIDSIRQTFE